jgi:hypothetical protein
MMHAMLAIAVANTFSEIHHHHHYGYPLKFYVSDNGDEMNWGNTSCEKIATVLTRLVPLQTPTRTPKHFLGCTAQRGKQSGVFAAKRGGWPGQPAYVRPNRPASLQQRKKGRVILWKMQRLDGCGSDMEYQLLTWALSHHLGWVYGGEMPNQWYTPEKPEFVFMESDCTCMGRFLGLPGTLHNRVKGEDRTWIKELVNPKIITGCDGRVDTEQLNKLRQYDEVNVQICGSRCPPTNRYMAMTCLLNRVRGFVPPCARHLASKLCPSRASNQCFSCLDTHRKKLDSVCKGKDQEEILFNSAPHCKKLLRSAVCMCIGILHTAYCIHHEAYTHTMTGDHRTQY